MKREEFYQQVRAFLVEESGEPVALTLTADDNIFDAGCVSSFSIVALISHIQELAGVRIDMTRYEFDQYYTLRSLYSVVTDSAVDRAGA